MVAAEEALGFTLRNRAQLFPWAPVVHMSVPSTFLQSIPPLPPDVIGIPLNFDFVGTVERALRWHPTARHLVVVTGTSAWDREWDARLRAQASVLAGRVSLEFLAGLPTDELLQHLRGLQRESIVFTPGFFRDGSGRLFSPREATQLVATASAAPVYGPFSTFIGTGVVGGNMASFNAIGRLGGRIALELLAGAAPASLTLPQAMPVPLHLDWRQVRRWDIAPQAIPSDAIVQFREPTLWEAYRRFVLIAGAVVLLQAGLIAALLFERRRRKRTEMQSAQDHAALQHMTRVSLLGQLSASIAHQLNQPLAAILGNAEAAQKMLGHEPVDLPELREICDDIVAEDQRAAAVIRRLGALFKRGEPMLVSLDVNELVRDTLEMTRTTLLTRQVTAVEHLAPDLPQIAGDRVQLQQMLLNLIVNAADAMDAVPQAARRMTISTESHGDAVRLCVADRGPGIPAQAMGTLFEPFWTTKAGGMGIGLAVCRAIALAHHGSLEGTNAPEGGAIFCAVLPARATP